MDPNNNHQSKPILLVVIHVKSYFLRRGLFAQLHHVLVGQDVVLATALWLVFGTPTPHPGVGKFRQNGFV
jgi:hypothetical protein